MNVASASGRQAIKPMAYTYLNPFVHKLDIEDTLDLAKIYFLTVFLVPFRIIGILLAILVAWMFACIGLYGLTLEDLKDEPLTGWRKKMQQMAALSMRLLYASGSFHNVKFKGRRATSKEAPILVAAPHSSYVDSLLVVVLGPPSIVAKYETSKIPIFGKLINFTQPIYVIREDQNSRQHTIRDIIERSRGGRWPQIVIFSEGTCTNRKALISFKGGAFYPGVPVQPVLLRYPNKYDTVTWTWDGPGVLRLLWLTCTQFHNNFEIEFLPVYTPNDEEKRNGKLYADNVRKVMARALNVPMSDYSFEDYIFLNKAKELKVPFAADIVEIERLINKLNLLRTDIDEKIADNYFKFEEDEIDFVAFARLLRIRADDERTQYLFSLLKKPNSNKVSIRNFVTCSFFIKTQSDAIIEFLRLIRKIYCEDDEGITLDILHQLVKHFPRNISPKDVDQLFTKIDYSKLGSISFDELERYIRYKHKYQYLFKQNKEVRRPMKGFE